MDDKEIKNTGNTVFCCLCDKEHEEIVATIPTKDMIDGEVYTLDYEYTLCPEHENLRYETDEQFIKNMKVFHDKLKELKNEKKENN